MESYDVFLCNNFVALPAFKEKYGIYDGEKNGYVITTAWQSALQVSGQLGALISSSLARSPAVSDTAGRPSRASCS
jgi:MFS transporter, SP family, general alpha glucoside:H+ symporter